MVLATARVPRWGAVGGVLCSGVATAALLLVSGGWVQPAGGASNMVLIRSCGEGHREWERLGTAIPVGTCVDMKEHWCPEHPTPGFVKVTCSAGQAVAEFWRSSGCSGQPSETWSATSGQCARVVLHNEKRDPSMVPQLQVKCGFEGEPPQRQWLKTCGQQQLGSNAQAPAPEHGGRQGQRERSHGPRSPEPPDPGPVEADMPCCMTFPESKTRVESGRNATPLTLQWAYDSKTDKVRLRLSASVRRGWVAVGFSDEATRRGMAGAELLIGFEGIGAPGEARKGPCLQMMRGTNATVRPRLPTDLGVLSGALRSHGAVLDRDYLVVEMVLARYFKDPRPAAPGRTHKDNDWLDLFSFSKRVLAAQHWQNNNPNCDGVDRWATVEPHTRAEAVELLGTEFSGGRFPWDAESFNRCPHLKKKKPDAHPDVHRRQGSNIDIGMPEGFRLDMEESNRVARYAMVIPVFVAFAALYYIFVRRRRAAARAGTVGGSRSSPSGSPARETTPPRHQVRSPGGHEQPAGGRGNLDWYSTTPEEPPVRGSAEV
eukprot:TRINITY_DN51127_c0_g1_i1.p1 TRINITY_DN51127_c0_g1~~TRINITY_DN51127_c0_g1_i1.p1  ORF type:complete len:572 (+),score=80.22 TRINITY_DN51127_c0_g1_i1:90-1718(+)